ncbi:hypothetical protein EYF80_018160 [Liparis tanakae]|uniref:Uncharacterized protein n=1 Tax=Liparis tanakae TaxID=230148 RepID=A0A4Z2I2E0_9TELE|nr:hypothetical protein EYF80_018160 [Liparis tanakae]
MLKNPPDRVEPRLRSRPARGAGAGTRADRGRESPGAPVASPAARAPPAVDEWVPAVESTRRETGDAAHLALAGGEGMRLRGGRDFDPSSYLELAPPPPGPVAWLPGVLSKGVRLRLRLDRRDNRGRGCWQLVDLEAESEPDGRRLRSRAPDACQ